MIRAIILDAEGCQLVGETAYEDRPSFLLYAVIPRISVDARPLAQIAGEPTALSHRTARAYLERRRGDGVYIYRLNNCA